MGNEAPVTRLREPKPEQIGAQVTAEMRERIDAIAVDRRWSRAEAARYLIERGLEALDAEGKAA